MCGICGLLQLEGGQPVSAELLDRMRDLIVHRGPDDAGSFVSSDGCVGLASRRLSIIDRSSAGHQPMSNEDGSIRIVYNGEMYNYLDHRAPLADGGHSFRSHTDTEVIIHLYEDYGPECVRHIRGMFAFAIWDSNRDELFLARDRLGIKPLYYARSGRTFIFASEIKCLLAHPNLSRAVDEESLYHFLTFLTTPAPKTLFKDIYKLPAGHRAVIKRNGDVRIEEYWDVFDSVEVDTTLTDADLIERLRFGLRESVGLRMISDVPFGVLLSGGIDSSTNVALMDSQMDRPVQTFSIGYKGVAAKKYNEFNFARRVAQHFGADHHEVLIGDQDLVSFLPKLIYHQDEPIADPVCVPVYYVAKLAKDSGTTVVQVGEGADELFGGYSHWMTALRLQSTAWPLYTSLPSAIRRLALASASPLIDTMRFEYLRRGSADEEMFWGGAIAFGESSKRNLLGDPYLRRVSGLTSHDVVMGHRKKFDDRSPTRDYLSWMSYIDLRMRLPELLLMRVDKMTMATSVEARVPFLDHELVSLAMSVPQKQRLHGYRPKYILKEAVRGLIPDDILDRPKQGFQVPVSQWLTDSLGHLAKARLHDFCHRTDYFTWSRVERLLHNRSPLVWYLLNFALWHEMWIEDKDLNLE